MLRLLADENFNVVHQRDAAFATIIDDLLLLDECSETAEWANQILYLPLR